MNERNWTNSIERAAEGDEDTEGDATKLAICNGFNCDTSANGFNSFRDFEQTIVCASSAKSST